MDAHTLMKKCTISVSFDGFLLRAVTFAFVVMITDCTE